MKKILLFIGGAVLLFSLTAGVSGQDASNVTIGNSPLSSLVQNQTFKPLIREPELVINPGGKFLARGMMIKSIGENSFMGEVWGTSWTVDVSRIQNLILKGGNEQKVEGVLYHLQVGEEVGVSGTIDKNSPGVISAHVVRNYSKEKLTEKRPVPEGGCIQVIAFARNPQTGETKEFPTPCDIPKGWEKVGGAIPQRDFAPGEGAIPQMMQQPMTGGQQPMMRQQQTAPFRSNEDIREKIDEILRKISELQSKIQVQQIPSSQ